MYNIILKTLLQQGISEPAIYGDLIYKFKAIIKSLLFLISSKKITKRYKRVGYILIVCGEDVVWSLFCNAVLNVFSSLPVGFLLLRYSVLSTAESLCLLCLLFCILIYMF